MSTSTPLREVDSLVEALLAEQGELTAVERYSQFHEDAAEPLQRQYYSALMPARPPGPGQQLAFEVDLDRCSGCKACVTACHSLNGLDEGEAWRDVGLILGGRPGLPVLQHVTSACHHCLEPACLEACPVNAYEKDLITGIVRHLDDQCFGCQYCTLACPYDVPKFHKGKGIVRKCDMCQDRLSAGEAPACVQACPHEAIRIRVVDRDEIAARSAGGDFLPGAPGPEHTKPTTRYVTTRPLPSDSRPADDHRIEPEHAHGPLVVMLVLTQLSVGTFLLDFGWRTGWGGSASGLAPHLILGMLFGLIGLNASLLHLGRPQFAYRALIGLRHSWLSREVLTFGLFAGLASGLLALEWLGTLGFRVPPTMRIVLSGLTVSAGVAGVLSSVMVYHITRRPFWQSSRSGWKFAGTTVLLGLATVLVGMTWTSASDPDNGRALGAGWIVLAALSAWKLLFEARDLARLRDKELTPLKRTAMLLTGPLARVTIARGVLGISGGIVLPVILATSGPVRWLAVLAFLAVLSGELLERYLFFAAVTRPKMPGGMH
ncbi:dimethyl sulfoxide reductase anchor subunit [soil metagenome]